MSMRARTGVASLDTVAGSSETELATYMLSLRSPPPHSKTSTQSSRNNTASLPIFDNKATASVLQSIENIQSQSGRSSPSVTKDKDYVSAAEINQYLQPASILVQPQQPLQQHQQQAIVYNVLSQAPVYHPISDPYVHTVPYTPLGTSYTIHQPQYAYSQPIQYISSTIPMQPMHQPVLSLSQPPPSSGLPDPHSTLQQYTHTNAVVANHRKRAASAVSHTDSPSKQASRYILKKYVPTEYDEQKGANQHASHRAAQGLRLCSAKVCSKLQQLQTSTYNDIADLLVNELSEQNASNGDSRLMEEKNIRRRIYDTLNVLLAMQIIERSKKDIRWMGLHAADKYVRQLSTQQSTQHAPISNSVSHALHQGDAETRIHMKQSELFDLILQYLNTYNLCRRNKHNAHHRVEAESSYHLQLPFILVYKILSEFDIYSNETNTHVMLQAPKQFDMARDTCVINQHFRELISSTHSKKSDLRAAVWQQLQQLLPADLYDYVLQHKHTDALLFRQIEQLADRQAEVRTNHKSFNTPSSKPKFTLTTPTFGLSPDILQLHSGKSHTSLHKQQKIDTTLASVGLSLLSPNKQDSHS